MEPLSAAATVIGVADPALRLVSALVRYGKDLKNAPAERRLLVEELLALEALLQRLFDREASLPVTYFAQQNGDHLRRLKQAYNDLAAALKYDSGAGAPVTRGRLRNLAALAKWPFTKEDIYVILQRVSRVQDTCNLLLADEQHIILRSLDQKQEAADHQRLKNSICQWLSSLNMAQTHQVIASRAAPNSGRWFTTSQTFRAWASGSRPLLWCYGILGAGKTVLASMAVNTLRQDISSYLLPAAPVAALYLRYNEPEQSMQNLFGSIIRQIIQDMPVTPSPVSDLYSRHGDGTTAATAEEMVKAIETILGDGTMYLIIDGLDECNEDLRWNLMEHLEVIRVKSRVMVVSRFFDRLEEELQDFIQFEIRANKEDIEIFIDQQIRGNRNLRRLVDKTPSLKDDIKHEILDTAQGMFLLVRLHIESLATAASLSIRHVRNRLSTLPNELNNAFDDAMKRIEGQESDQISIAMRTIAWITHVFRPLSVKELQHALAFEPTESYLDEELILEGHSITNLCAGLVVIDQSSNSINFVHFSALRYFQDNSRKLFPGFHGVITMKCAMYLMLPSIGNLSIDRILHDYPLAYYAAQYIGNHARLAPEDTLEEPVLKLLCRLFSHPKERKLLLSLLHGLNLITAGVKGFEESEEIDALEQFNIADVEGSALGIETEVDMISGQKSVEDDMPCIDGLSLTPMTTGDSDAATLVDKPASKFGVREVQARKIPEVTALHLAASMGLTRVAAMLVGGADHIDAVDASGKTALTVAIEKGFEKAVELLLLSGASVDLNSEHGRMVLLLVIERDWTSAAAAIISAAEMKTTDGAKNDQYTIEVAIILAVLNGQKEKLTSLAGTIDFKSTSSKTGDLVLLLAVEQQRVDVVERLLKMGVNVNSRDSVQQTPLFRATKRQNHHLMQSLLNHGAIVDIYDENGRTPWSANLRCSAITLAILLEAGADPNTKGLQGSSELYTAAGDGDIAIVQYMLACGTNPSIQTDHLWAPLHWAAYHGHHQVIQQLVTAGADLSPVSTSGVTPLDLAQQAGQIRVVSFLRQRGALNASSIGSQRSAHAVISPNIETAMPPAGTVGEGPVPEGDRVTLYFEKPLARSLIDSRLLGQSIRPRLHHTASEHSYQISNCMDLASKVLSIRRFHVDDPIAYYHEVNATGYPLAESMFDSGDTLYDMRKSGAGFELHPGRQAVHDMPYLMTREWTGDWTVTGLEGDQQSYLIRTSHDWSTTSKDNCRWMLKDGTLIARSGWEASSPRFSSGDECIGKDLQDLLVACWVANLWAEAPVPRNRDRTSSSSFLESPWSPKSPKSPKSP